MSDDPKSVERIVDAAIQNGAADVVFLEESLELGVSPPFIKRRFGKLLTNLSADEILDVFLLPFQLNSDYVTEILRNQGLSREVGISLLESALEYAFILGRLQVDKITNWYLEDTSDEIRMAWKLFRLLQHTSLWRGVPTELGIKFEDILDDIVRIAQDPSAVLQLRAVCLAFLCQQLFRSRKSQPLQETLENSLSLADENLVETTERILYRVSGPSLEAIPAMAGGEEVHRSAWGWRPRGPEAVPMWVLLPFNGDQIHQVIRTAGYPKEALKESKIGLLRIKLALQSGGLALHNPEIGLTPKMVASTLEVITPILKRRGPDEWRAWAGLGHLALFRWFDNSHPRSSETGLEGALTQLCGFMEENVNSFRGRWEIAGVLARCAEFGCLETIQRKLLEILYRMPDGRVSGRKSPRFHLWSYEAGQVGQLFEIARKAGEPAFFGFLKFFFYLNQIAEMSEGYGKIQIPRLNFDAKHIMSLVERSQGSIREGALLLLTSGDSLPFADTIRLLEFSKSDYKPVGRSWAKLVIETIRDLYDPAATDFIEAILSSAAKYPRAVKYAALGKYLQIATATTVDIKSQEEKLGLPFQPIS